MTNTSGELPVVVIGAGAAGLLAAIFAAQGPRPVLLLERTRDGGRKILISGGGRCNILPSRIDPDQYFTASSRNTLRKMLLSWPLPEQRRFFEQEVGLRLELEEETGKLFPSTHSARSVRDGLFELARRRGVGPRMETTVVGLHPPTADRGWQVATDHGPIDAHAVIIATGGLSVPATGSDGTGMRIVQQLGHTLNPTYAALTPLTADPPVHSGLAGVSLPVKLHAADGKDRLTTAGGFLFTHRGYSGPSALDVSHVAVRALDAGQPPPPILAQWSELDAAAWERLLLDRPAATVIGIARRHLPHRLADHLVAETGVDPHRTPSQLRREERSRLVEAFARYPLPVTGHEGYKKAEVTGGGVPLGEVDPRTLQSRVVPGLYLCGEILDCFGPIGGYNFYWAWATGRAAGLGAGMRGE
jgi:predicted Rossmann fold flavoprotein